MNLTTYEYKQLFIAFKEYFAKQILEMETNSYTLGPRNIRFDSYLKISRELNNAVVNAERDENDG